MEKVIQNSRKHLMIGFIGAGQMAQAFAKGLVESGLFLAEQVFASDPNEAARNRFLKLLPGSNVTANNLHLASSCKTIVAAVKPQQMQDVLSKIGGAIDDSHLLISIAAGIRLTWMASQLTNEVRLVRVMPNTPCLVGQGVSGYAMGRGATDDDAMFVDRLLCSVGVAFRVDEQQLNAVTALSGSGPAFYCAILESLATGAEQCGLPRELATTLALQTMQGTASYLQQTKVTPTELIKRVSSPGGTTVAGLAALDAGNLQKVLEATVKAAARRSAELGED